MATVKMRTIVTVLFSDFETLDAFGPVEVFGRLGEHFTPAFYSQHGGLVTSAQQVPVPTRPFSEIHERDFILLVPGGIGTRVLAKDAPYIEALRDVAARAEYILTVCTGSGLFANTGLLDGKRATSNKLAFAWAKSQGPNVQWVYKARWVQDGNVYTSSGVTAGIDMTLAFVADLLGYDVAKQQANEIEHEWNEDPAHDPFADLYA